MPFDVTIEQVVCALNKTLAEMQPKGTAISSLDDDNLSDREWSCGMFASTLLNKISGNQGDLQSHRYTAESELPPQMESGSFVNISMLGEPSVLNHNFNIFVSGDSTYLIQAFLNQSVEVVRQFNTQVFWEAWKKLSGNEWQQAYVLLFAVKPGDVFAEPLPEKWLEYQYVTPMP